ncbi:MAG: adenylate kinase [Dehalococcoidia bacterium]
MGSAEERNPFAGGEGFPVFVVLLGAPGAGKGTQAVNLSRELGLAHVASGDLFREHIRKGTPLGTQAQSYHDRGELVPDQIAVKMILERLEAPDCERGAILDGFPRTTAQAKALDEALEEGGKGIAVVLYVRVSEEELVRRLSGRWICRNCQTPYHAVSSPPKVAGVCDRCGGELYQRPDDTEETTRNRLRVYMENTAPLIDYYVNRNKLVEIDGEQTIEEVGKSMASALKAQVGER